MRYHFECRICGFDDGEARRLAAEHEIYCPLCAEDNLRLRELLRWPEGTPSYKCPRCSTISFNANDIANRYCGKCRKFEED